MISIHHLSKWYGEKQVLNNVTIELPIGEGCSIMGESGVGKTTLLRILLGLEGAQEGTIDGLANMTKSVIFQEDCLCEEFDAITNIRLVLPRTVTTETICNHLMEVGLKEEELHQPVNTFSGGMKRRVAIVRCMMKQADVIFMDEPLKGLDTMIKEKVIQYIQKEMNHRTFFLITHEESEAKRLASHHICLEKR